MDTWRFASFELPEPRVDEPSAQSLGREALPVQLRQLLAGQGGPKVAIALPDQGEYALVHRWSYRVAWPLPPVA